MRLARTILDFGGYERLTISDGKQTIYHWLSPHYQQVMAYGEFTNTKSMVQIHPSRTQPVSIIFLGKEADHLRNLGRKINS